MSLTRAEACVASFRVGQDDTLYSCWFFGPRRDAFWLRDSPAHARAMRTYEEATAHRAAGRFALALGAAERAAAILPEAAALVDALRSRRRNLIALAVFLGLVALGGGLALLMLLVWQG